MKRGAVHLGLLAAVLVLAGFFVESTRTVVRYAVEPVIGDAVGYLRQAQLFKERGWIGGLDTSISDDVSLYVLRKSLAVGHEPGPFAHIFQSRTSRVVVQYPPGTGFLFSFFPDGLQERLSFLLNAGAVYVGLLALILRAQTPGIALLAAGIGAYAFYGLRIFVFDWSIPPSVALMVAAGWLTVGTFAAATPARRTLLASLLGLALGLAVDFRIANVFLLFGFGLVFLFDFFGQRDREAFARPASFAIGFLIGILPVLAANAINAGHPFATTYGPGHAALPTPNWKNFLEGIDLFFIKNPKTGATIFLAAAVVGLFGLAVRRSWAPRAGAIFTIAVANLLFSALYMTLHPARAHYYLFPACMFALATVFFAWMESERRRVLDAPGPTPSIIIRAAVGLAALVLPVLLISRFDYPISPNYAKPNVELRLEPSDVVWASATSGRFHIFLRRQASLLPPDRATQDRLIAAIAEDGIRQVVVADDPVTRSMIDRLRKQYELRRIGLAFGYDVYAIEGRPRAR